MVLYFEDGLYRNCFGKSYTAKQVNTFRKAGFNIRLVWV